MVNKMKLKLLFLSLLLLSTSLQAKTHLNGLQTIASRGYVACGTDTSNSFLVYKDEANEWRGPDADICRIFAIAMVGNENSFDMINITAKDASKALDDGKIDIMLGNSAISAKQEISFPMMAMDLLYIDRQLFASRHKTDFESMDGFKESKVCVVADTLEEENLAEYNQRYVMKFKIITFPNEDEARKAFYLERCQLITGTEFFLNQAVKSLVSKNNDITILPEVIASRPVYAYCSKDNPNLRIIGKWVINALKLAEQYGINSKNIDTFIGIRNRSLKNLLGVETNLWNEFGLRTDWVKVALEKVGNYGEFFEKNIGNESALNVPRDKNKLIKDGGFIGAVPFI